MKPGVVRRRGALGAGVFSACGRYRYALTRTIGPVGTHIMFVMLNPSVADEDRDDATLRRCVGFARAWGAGRLSVCNVFALRSRDPSALRRHPDPAGPSNRRVIAARLGRCDRVVCAWGALAGEDGWAMADWLRARRDLWCLGRVAEGHPRHPLYVPASRVLERYELRQTLQVP